MPSERDRLIECSIMDDHHLPDYGHHEGTAGGGGGRRRAILGKLDKRTTKKVAIAAAGNSRAAFRSACNY